MKKVCLLLGCLFMCLMSYSQDDSKEISSTMEIAGCMRDIILARRQQVSNFMLSKNAEVPLLIDGEVKYFHKLKNLKYDSIKSIKLNLEPDQLLTALFGLSARYGVIEIEKK